MNGIWHFLVSFIWAVYGIAIGVLAVVYNYQSYWVWLSVIVAITGNSAHLVAFAWSQKGIQISSANAEYKGSTGKTGL